MDASAELITQEQTHRNKKTVKEKLGSCIRFISIGKYNQGLYHKGELQYSSLFGGIVSIIFAIGFIAYLWYTLAQIFSSDPHFTMSSKIEDLLLYEPFVNDAAKLGRFDKNFIDSFQLRMETKYNISCDQIKVQFYYKEKHKPI